MFKLSGMHGFLLGLALASGTGVAVVLHQHARTQRLAQACDTAAASPFDDTRPAGIPGVPFEQIAAQQAIEACHEATADQPADARLQHQHGRALQAGQRLADALVAYRQADRLGSIPAGHNIGSIYLIGGQGVAKDEAAAVAWFERTAAKGYPLSQRAAAELLEHGQGAVAANPERAAFHWRTLADHGDAQAAEHVGLGIKSGSFQPQSDRELWDRLSAAAEQHHTRASIEAAQLLKDSNATPEQIQLGARYALDGYRNALKATIDSEEGWPLYPWRAFQLFQHFVKAGARNDMTMDEARAAEADFSGPVKKFTVPIDCDGTQVAFSLYLWQWQRNYPQSDTQFQWLQAARRCTPPEAVAASFQKIFAIAAENQVNFPDLAVRAFSREPDPPPQQIAEPMEQDSISGRTAGSGLSGGETVGVALAALACWYWSDQCKELAMEAAKQGIRELLKSN